MFALIIKINSVLNKIREITCGAPPGVVSLFNMMWVGICSHIADEGLIEILMINGWKRGNYMNFKYVIYKEIEIDEFRKKWANILENLKFKVITVRVFCENRFNKK